jgi:hypothetical protein
MEAVLLQVSIMSKSLNTSEVSSLPSEASDVAFIHSAVNRMQARSDNAFDMLLDLQERTVYVCIAKIDSMTASVGSDEDSFCKIVIEGGKLISTLNEKLHDLIPSDEECWGHCASMVTKIRKVSPNVLRIPIPKSVESLVDDVNDVFANIVDKYENVSDKLRILAPACGSWIRTYEALFRL